MIQANEVGGMALPNWEGKLAERCKRAVAAAHIFTNDQVAEYDTPLWACDDCGGELVVLPCV